MQNMFYHRCIWPAVSAQVGVAEAGAQIGGRIPSGTVQPVGKVSCPLLLPQPWAGVLCSLPNGGSGDA